MNHQHIDDLLSGAENVGIDNLFALGQVIKQMWENRLKSCYPARTFQVSCNQDEYTVVMSFCQTPFHETSPAKPLDVKGERVGTMTVKTWTIRKPK